MNPEQLVQLVIDVGAARVPAVPLVEGPRQGTGARTICVAGHLGRGHQKVATVPTNQGRLEVYYSVPHDLGSRAGVAAADMQTELVHRGRQLRIDGIPANPTDAQKDALRAVILASINANPCV